MESVPAVFAGTVFTLFGATLLLWTGSRMVRSAPVTPGGGSVATALTMIFGMLSLLTGLWCLVQA